MDAPTVACECGTKLKIPTTLTAASAVQCPKCGAVVKIAARGASAGSAPSHPQVPKPEMKTFDDPIPFAEEPVVAAAASSSGNAAASKTCPYCGETILASAVKCRHCGEFLDGAARPTVAKRSVAASHHSEDEPNPSEYFVALLLGPIGFLIGGLWAAQGKPKAKKMCLASALSSVIMLAGFFIVKTYVLDKESDESGPSIPADAPRVPEFYAVVPEGERDSDSGPPGRMGQGPAPGGGRDLGGVVDLSGQPEHVQRAMRANVRIEQDRGVGSGVVVQREGDDVLILTNRHVIDSTKTPNPPDVKNVGKPRITYYDEQSNPGSVLWIAPEGIDLALVKARAPRDIEPVSWTNAPQVLAGQEVFAVGNPVGLGWTYTRGVVSAIRQSTAGDFKLPLIQTDTQITYGNSGGGLYSSNGELIGINSAIVNPALGGGLGFAIRPQILLELKPPGLDLPGS